MPISNEWARTREFAHGAAIAGSATAGTFDGVGSYPKKLRGPITVTYSLRLEEPTWHLEPGCAGLERVPEEARAERTFADAMELGMSPEGRACRLCCMERLLRSVLRPGRSKNAPRQHVTISGETPDRGPFPGWDRPSRNGLRRLRRIARHTGLTIHHNGRATILCGEVSEDGVEILKKNLRSYTLETPESEEVLSIFWALVSDEPGAEEPRIRELLDTARLLSR